MLAAGVIKVLTGRKNLHGLRAGSTSQFQQSRVQALIQKQMSGEDTQHFQQVPRIGPAYARGPLLILLSHFCYTVSHRSVLRSLVLSPGAPRRPCHSRDFRSKRASQCKLEIWRSEPQLASRATHDQETVRHESGPNCPKQEWCASGSGRARAQYLLLVRTAESSPRIPLVVSRRKRKS